MKKQAKLSVLTEFFFPSHLRLLWNLNKLVPVKSIRLLLKLENNCYREVMSCPFCTGVSLFNNKIEKMTLLFYTQYFLKICFLLMFFFSFFCLFMREVKFLCPCNKVHLLFFSINFYGNIFDLQYCESVSS